MGTRQDIKVFLTAEHDCGYWPERRAQDLVLDPADPSLASTYEWALSMGFRRSGGHVYRPHCRSCRDCIPVRIPVHRFSPNRNQRRSATRNQDLTLNLAPAVRTDENFRLYQRYLASRHTGGPMDDPSHESFDQFLACMWSPTRFFEFRLNDELIAVAVTDVTEHALSAVYTFFEPTHAARSLGTYAILRQMQWARENHRDHLYLGFWLENHPKMDYKRLFRPVERLNGQQWES